MEIYKKLQECRQEIKSTELKKEGRNNFSNYYYFTPSQVEKLVFDACVKQNLFCKFDLKRTPDGLIGYLDIINLDDFNDSAVFQMATDIPEIKATNIAQQLGGAMTYTERYLKMTVFGIVDNTLDFDAPKKEEKKEQPKKQNDEDKEWLNPNTENYDNVLKAMIDGWEIKQVRLKYKVSKKTEEKLNEDIKAQKNNKKS